VKPRSLNVTLGRDRKEMAVKAPTLRVFFSAKMPDTPALSEYVSCVEAQRAGVFSVIKRNFLEEV
jgi:hypothetical protein